jgi:hypothetical protein
MANIARVTLRREALLHLELIYFRRNRTHCAHIYHSKLTSTQNSRPVSRTKPARNRTAPGRARKVQTRKTRNVRAEILRLPARAQQARPRGRDIRTDITAHERHDLPALGPRARHVDIVDIADLDPAGVLGARARRRLVALSGSIVMGIWHRSVFCAGVLA